MNNLKKKIEFYIGRDSSVVATPFKSINLTNSSEFFTGSINVTNNNASIHFQLKPLTNKTIGYLVLLKFGGTPILTNSSRSYDYWKLFCPLGF